MVSILLYLTILGVFCLSYDRWILHRLSHHLSSVGRVFAHKVVLGKAKCPLSSGSYHRYKSTPKESKDTTKFTTWLTWINARLTLSEVYTSLACTCIRKRGHSLELGCHNVCVQSSS